MYTRPPKFLTARMAEHAALAAWDAICRPPATHSLNPKRLQAHIIVLVPGYQTSGAADEMLRLNDEPYLLYEVSFGRGSEPGDCNFEYPFDQIARNKAGQLWQGRNDGGTDIQPHLLFQGETPFWGGVKRHGMVAACSGVQPWIDRAVAGMTLDLLVAMSYEAWMTSSDHADDELCFLTPPATE